jgi:hypothetical protein
MNPFRFGLRAGSAAQNAGRHEMQLRSSLLSGPQGVTQQGRLHFAGCIGSERGNCQYVWGPVIHHQKFDRN